MSSGNSSFTGTRYVLNKLKFLESSEVVSPSIGCTSLSCQDSPFVRHTLVGSMPLSYNQAPFPATTVPTLLVDPISQDYVQLPIGGYYLASAFLEFNAFGPNTVGGGTMGTAPTIGLGTSILATPSISYTIGGAAVAPFAGSTTVIGITASSNSLTGVTAFQNVASAGSVAGTSATAALVSLGKLTSASVTSPASNYLAVAFIGSGFTPGSGDALGTFVTYLSYISL
jgi:hypothetical protein